MKILYFDTFSLFYSQQYMENNPSVSEAYEGWRNKSPTNLLKAVRPDLAGIDKLRRAAIESGFKLYPLGTRYTRSLFIVNRLFDERELAPDKILSIRMGDNDPIRRMLAHSQELEATWYVCGDAASEILSASPKRYLTSIFGLGVTDELIAKIYALKAV
ncbi:MULTISPECIES: hypothetical protein [Vibrio]|uniref:HAD family hydrolase n=1 Tax=Vibrio kanaloae TaxID=170673 RepID=A0ABV4LIC6_9VIBR|nr:hypothetical protein [Vibrio kanaloae]OEF12155.1 hypothetical protein A132_01730 [Vibrio kanaloae 5S-149]